MNSLSLVYHSLENVRVFTAFELTLIGQGFTLYSEGFGPDGHRSSNVNHRDCSKDYVSGSSPTPSKILSEKIKMDQV